MRRLFTVLVLVLVGVVIWQQRVVFQDYLQTLQEPDLPPAVPYHATSTTDSAPDEQTEDAVTGVDTTDVTSGEDGMQEAAPPRTQPSDTTAEEVHLAVPFQPQAPHGNWNLPYQEACEEASVIMAVAYYQNESRLTADEMDSAILDLVEWEAQQGYAIDVSITELAQIVEAYYEGYQTRVLTHVTIDAIQAELRKGYPVILPFAGREIGNPYYSGEGPLYHMMVVTGYTDDGFFITNDPGTRRGADYLYEQEHLLSAVADWTGAQPDGPPKALVILPH